MSSQALFLFRRLTTRERRFPAYSCSSFSLRTRTRTRNFSQSAQFHKTQCGLYVDRSLPPTFDKILIANRGEIACRVIRTCRQVGIKTVAVYSDADANSMHTQMADESYRIGEAAAASSYLRMDKILEVARLTGAQAIHPGYGFLSENETFARKCEEAKIKFIGPPPKAIHAMGSKSASKEIMINAGVPVVPGYHGEDQSVSTLKAEAKRVGYPVMLKAVHGGGGKGMRIVFKPEDFESALESCKRESKASFGNDSVLVERYIQRPRHIEFQIFADQHNNAVHLYERDCSVQRRHQKVLEEAPAPGMPAELRAKMGKAAVDAALAVGYEGAGTVEFIFDAETDEYFFMEMNTRLQVEHPVTEMVMKRDLVQWQLHVAAGNKLPATQDQLTALGHALEARIYAEDPDNNFLPATGKLVHLFAPPLSPDLRVETGVREGDQVSIFYDPMISKLVVWGPNRHQCIRRMQQALESYRVVGPPNNIPFLKRAVAHPEFLKGKVETGFIPKNLPALLGQTETAGALPQKHFAAAGIFQLLLNEKRIAKEKKAAAYDSTSPWNFLDTFRVNSEETRDVTLLPTKKTKEAKQEQLHAKVKTFAHSTCGTRGDYSIEFADGSKVRVSGTFNPTDSSKPSLLLTVDDRAYRADVVRDDLKLHVFVNGEQASFALPEVVYGGAASGSGGVSCVAPMAGKVVKVMVKANDAVQKGTPLLIMEAMKMETVIQADAPGVVEAVHFQPGDFVEGGKVVVSFAKNKGDKEKKTK